ncbi:MAG TPA: hypothetical protein VKW06_10455 [Candidatus Angelobacter sp.]|nr:hypothetical protein [Candidatus Angelobacter sp.]
MPDQLVTASGVSESFSPNTPDAIMVSILQSQGQQLPADLAAKYAAATSGQGSSGATGSVTTPPTPAVTASGQPVSTQTAAGLRLVNILSIAPGVYQCSMSDGSQHYCDVDGNPINYTPPPPTPAAPPAASQPTATVQPPPPAAPAAFTPSGQPISTTSGTPLPPAPAPAATPAAPGLFTSIENMVPSSITTWIQGSMIAGIPNWILAGGAALLLFGMSGSGGRHR